jgi:hypothetical protein
MRTEGIKVKLTIPIRFDKPDLNGAIHSREAVNKALQQLHKDTPPLLFRSNEDDNPKVIGHIADSFQMTEWDNENGICKLTINGLIYYGGMGIVVNECHRDENGNVVIDDFRISSIGFSL